jgi:hypothetical protein
MPSDPQNKATFPLSRQVFAFGFPPRDIGIVAYAAADR